MKDKNKFLVIFSLNLSLSKKFLDQCIFILIKLKKFNS